MVFIKHEVYTRPKVAIDNITSISRDTRRKKIIISKPDLYETALQVNSFQPNQWIYKLEVI